MPRNHCKPQSPHHQANLLRVRVCSHSHALIVISINSSSPRALNAMLTRRILVAEQSSSPNMSLTVSNTTWSNITRHLSSILSPSFVGRGRIPLRSFSGYNPPLLVIFIYGIFIIKNSPTICTSFKSLGGINIIVIILICYFALTVWAGHNN